MPDALPIAAADALMPHRGPRFVRDSSPTRNPDRLLSNAIARAKEGDTGALHFLYVRFADDVRGYIQSIVHDQHEAEDITHTLFAKLMTKIQRYEQREVPFAAWILRVARNAALDHVRARRAIPCDEVRTSDEHGDEAAIERGASLRTALEQLPAEQREVLVLRHIAGLSPGEIAERLGKTESSIHGLHHRGRGALQTALRDLDAAPVTAGA
jgi:RNA polymerase sigma-70 factor (ECF subfamily)